MYDDILGEVDKIKEIKSRKFSIKKEEKKEEDQLGLFEDLVLEMDDLEEILEEIKNEGYSTTYR